MKVVLFCGGLGLRIRDYSDNIPKPMVTIGYRPILWHVMKYYAHFGHKEFILCLGHRADLIKQYFLNYDECLTNDFTLQGGGNNLDLVNRDIHDWKIHFVDTGVQSNVGQRLWAVQDYVKNEEMFLANYCDGLSDIHFPDLLAYSKKHNKIATMVTTRPNLTYHSVVSNEEGFVTGIQEVSRSGLRINAGHFLFKPKVFDYMRDGEELVAEPFRRLSEDKELVAYTFDGFFAAMDTFKDKQALDDIVSRGPAPWELWKTSEKVDRKRAGSRVVREERKKSGKRKQ
ncbi:MAG TPA: glucose-1-phosphate cytidylyltransferase [Candidatus Saccharimonadales bacterium]|nr:glucose-1-phosphate cytidylyltransferase [Candidatus Saccharimonadales bacterium]